MKIEKIGEWLALVGFVIAVLAGLATGAGWSNPWVAVLLVVLGIIVGLTTITEKEVTSFLIAAIVLIVAGATSFTDLNTVVSPLGTLLNSIFQNVAVLIAPAALIVAVKAVYALASKK